MKLLKTLAITFLVIGLFQNSIALDRSSRSSFIELWECKIHKYTPFGLFSWFMERFVCPDKYKLLADVSFSCLVMQIKRKHPECKEAINECLNEFFLMPPILISECFFKTFFIRCLKEKGCKVDLKNLED